MTQIDSKSFGKFSLEIKTCKNMTGSKLEWANVLKLSKNNMMGINRKLRLIICIKIYFVGIEDADLEHVVGALVNCCVVGLLLAVPLELHHRGNHVDSLLVQVVIRDTLRR